MGGRLKGFEANPGLEWRARLFLDPVARLRYLRRATGTASRRPWVRMRCRPLRAGTVPLLLALAWIPCVVSDASTHGYPRVFRLLSSAPPPNVWQVEETQGYAIFSNGLRLENRFTVRNRPRGESAGIVFHTTESFQLPLEPGRNRALKLIGEALLEYVRQKRAYHFVIDRFGRVYRVVAETDAANHAGHSVWASGRRAYINLNESFFGVAFEAQSQTPEGGPVINPAQVYAGRMLTEMLRSRYRIPEENCVTHAQVSVNPGNMRAGYHMDWARAFPFREFGLPDNYWRPLPSVRLFGFLCDASFRQRAGAPLGEGIALAEGILHDTALTEGFSVPAYRQVLQKRYREMTTALRNGSASKEIWNEANGESSDTGDRP